MAEECKNAVSKDRTTGGVTQATRSRRRRNRARVKLLLAGKMEEATIQNIQFVRQQRDALHRRFQKAKEAKSRRRQSRLAMHEGASALRLGTEDADTGSEDQWEVDSAATVTEEGERGELEEGASGPSEPDRDDVSSATDPSSSISVTSEEEDPAANPSPSHPTAPRIPKTAAELDEVERDGFLKWRRMLANMEEEGVVLTPYERNIEVWRQLWRVIERSDLVLQIVDGRSPMFFRCKDLEKYIKEVSANKRVCLICACICNKHSHRSTLNSAFSIGYPMVTTLRQWC
ncbi:uncharacterized protein EMH_0098600 [Eimeria mitis]|uniref:Uncharacterized protein n=1 Tax=Eimeria mitis TaxID=44415 RepID=U6KFP4_9EIME|nr:uncharacterized protein EMH_0098600 [Eimeria mitis]CDJ35606.1 hypothetical protein EMH_0098600 [Eimeria mitis]